MPMLSGQDGKVLADSANVANITQWKFVSKAGGVSYASSATGGFRQRLPGVRQGSGSVKFVQDTASPIQVQLAEGDAVTLELYVDADNFYSVPAVIETLALETDIDTDDLVAGEFTFETTGEWTPPDFGV
jgi:hypothetical protein